jgi:acetyltransferase
MRGVLISTNHQNEHSDTQSIRKKYTTLRTLKNGVMVVFRPIECIDKTKFQDFFKSLSASSVHFRFFGIIKELPNETVEKYCNLDYNQEMAIVAEPQSEDKIVGVVRLVLDSDMRQGEFALVVADAWQGLGLGIEFLNYIIKVARDYGLSEIHCFVSSDNKRMILLAKKVGLKVKSTDGDTLHMTLQLS